MLLEIVEDEAELHVVFVNEVEAFEPRLLAIHELTRAGNFLSGNLITGGMRGVIARGSEIEEERITFFMSFAEELKTSLVELWADLV